MARKIQNQWPEFLDRKYSRWNLFSSMDQHVVCTANNTFMNKSNLIVGQSTAANLNVLVSGADLEDDEDCALCLDHVEK